MVKKAMNFLADRTITRAEAAAMLGRTIKEKQAQDLEYVDKDAIPKWAQEHIKVLLGLKIMGGYPDNSFRPEGRMTRAEAAVMFDNYMRLKKQ